MVLMANVDEALRCGWGWCAELGREILCVFVQPHHIINHICPLHIDDHRCNPVSFFSHFFTPVLAHHHLRLHATHPCLHEIMSRIRTWSVFFFSFYPFHSCPQPTHTHTQSRQPPAPSKLRLLSFFFLYPHPPVSTTIPHPCPLQPTPRNMSACNYVHHPHLWVLFLFLVPLSATTAHVHATHPHAITSAIHPYRVSFFFLSFFLFLYPNLRQPPSASTPDRMQRICTQSHTPSTPLTVRICRVQATYLRHSCHAHAHNCVRSAWICMPHIFAQCSIMNVILYLTLIPSQHCYIIAYYRQCITWTNVI